jgi:hypothetical protein
MASLLERIQQVGAEGPQPQQKGIEKVLRQRGGRATRRRGPAATAVGEQAAIGAGREALREQSFAERVAGVQARGREVALAEEQAAAERQLARQRQTQQEQLASEAALTREGIRAGEEEARLRREAGTGAQIRNLNTRAEQTLRDLASQRNIQMDDIFAQFEASSAELEDRRDAAAMEQQAFLLAMQDRKYLEELDRIGKQRQLENDIAFDNEMQRIVMGENMDSLIKELKFKTGRAAKQRDFANQLAQIDIDSAIDLSRAAIRDEATRTKWQAAGTLGGIAAGEIAKGEEGLLSGLFGGEESGEK